MQEKNKKNKNRGVNVLFNGALFGKQTLKLENVYVRRDVAVCECFWCLLVSFGVFWCLLVSFECNYWASLTTQ